MPQATEEQRAEWGGQQGVGEDKAMQFLEAAGYKLLRNWHWLVPDGREPTKDEIGAMCFLVDEWDFGGFVTHEEIKRAKD